MSSHDIGDGAGTASAKASSGSASDLPPPSERGELEPCPFCGCTRIYERGFRRFECPDCRAEGPPSATRAEAVAAWNIRALSAEAQITRLEGERERAHKSLRALQEGAAIALSKLGSGGDGLVADFLCAIHREAVRGLLASDGVTNEAAP